MTWLAVAVGGALGSLVRPATNQVTHTYSLTTKFPIGTAIVNLVGCVVVGLLAGLLAVERIRLPLYWREFVFVGLIGGLAAVWLGYQLGAARL